MDDSKITVTDMPTITNTEPKVKVENNKPDDDEPDIENTPEEKEAMNLMLQSVGEDPARWQNAKLHTAPPKDIMRQARRNVKEQAKQQAQTKVTLQDVVDELSDDEPPKEIVPTQPLKQAVDRMLLCYCRMQTHSEEHEEDFSASEMEAVTDMAMDLLVRVFPRLTGRTDSQTRTKTMNYLKIYYEWYKLKQIESRRQSFLDEFTDVIRLGEMEDFFLETSLELAKPIQQISRKLDAQVNDQQRRSRSIK